ncbi:MAG: SDR family oxidoreductase [Candidatus Kapaibacteriota bacterium]
MKIDLAGKVALVCGASQGIGRAIAYQFAASGAELILVARSESKLKELSSDLTEITNKQHFYISCDISNIDELKKGVLGVLEKIGNVDILVNNTGGPPQGLLHTSDLYQLEKFFRQHILSAQKLITLLLPGMIKQAFGRIINVVSIGMRQPIYNLGVSNVVRGAMGSWAKTLSRELAHYGITVNNILPGYTLTDRLKSIIQNNANEKGISFNEEANFIIENIPAKRFAKPEEIAFLATFLASDYAAYINGTSIPVDGGFLSCI